MNSSDIAHRRLHHQHISDVTFVNPWDVVAWMGAVQAQDYSGALWAIGLRTRHATERTLEDAIAKGMIVRTWPMRGTLHIVAAEDVKWMLALLAPRALAKSAGRRRQLGLDQSALDRSRDVLIAALEGGKQLQRRHLYQALEAANIATGAQRGLHILGYLAQQGLVCFGPHVGKQPTFVLLDEWVPHAKRLERDAAVAELTRRYFTSHGPATIQDFMWWSGLTTADANAGLAMNRSQLTQETITGQTYWMPRQVSCRSQSVPPMVLLPAFDEYLLGYRDRGAILDPRYTQHVQPGKNGMFSPTMVRDGQIIGTWRRTLKHGALVVTAVPFAPLTDSDSAAFASAAQHYGRFLETPVLQ